MIPVHHIQQLQHFMDMLHFLIRRLIISVFPHLNEVPRHLFEVALKHLHLLMVQIRDLKQIDPGVRDIGLQLLRNLQRVQNRERPSPVMPVSEVQNQCHDRGGLFALPDLSQLSGVFCPVVSHDPQRHPGIRLRLVFESDAGDPDVVLNPLFDYIPLDLPNLSVRLKRGAGSPVRQILRLDYSFTIEQQHVDDIGKDIVIGLQGLLRDILFGHRLHLRRSAVMNIISNSEHGRKSVGHGAGSSVPLPDVSSGQKVRPRVFLVPVSF